MKKFILTNIFYVSQILGLVVVLLVLNWLIIDSYRFNIAEDKNILVLGDSNTKFGVNDSIIGNAVNISSSGESFMYSYLKLKKALKSNHHIDTVLLSFSPHNVFADIEDRWLYDHLNLEGRMGDYYPMMEHQDLMVFYKHHGTEILNTLPSVIRKSTVNIFKYFSGKNVDFGGYLGLRQNNINEARIELERNSDEINLNEANTQIEYIKKMIDLCREHSIAFILINTPKLDELYADESYRSPHFYEVYQKHFSDIVFIDLHAFEIPESGYSDLMHLNHDGASYFSDYIYRQGLYRLIQDYTFKDVRPHFSLK